jgi:hypothetical protein
MRSWSGATSALASVVRIEKLITQTPSGDFHRSQTPAKAITWRGSGWIQNGVRVLPLGPDLSHSKKPSAGTRQRRRARASLKARLSAALSARALIMRAPSASDFAHGGTRPHLASSIARGLRPRPDAPLRSSVAARVRSRLATIGAG